MLFEGHLNENIDWLAYYKWIATINCWKQDVKFILSIIYSKF
jgi:hypothetical protein